MHAPVRFCPSPRRVPWTRALFPFRAPFLVVLALAACEEPQVATTIERFGGAAPQTAQVNTAVPDAPAVKVLDQNGESIGGVRVSFAVAQGGGSVGVATATTNGQGVASSGSWTLGTTAGANALTATVQGLAPLSFQATGTPGNAAAVAFVGGGGQQARVGQEVADRPSVRVTDAFQNATPNVPVVFAIDGGAGQVSGGAQTTDQDGVATVGAWTMGPTVGENRLRASIPGGAAATVSAQSTPGEPASMTKQAGDGQSARVDTDVPVAPSLQVRDRFGNPVPGVTVSFSASGGDGSVGPAPAQSMGAVEPGEVASGPDGLAAVTRWRLGTRTGENRLTATAGAASATFTATGTAGSPASLSASAGNGQTASAGGAVPVRPAVAVQDEFGNGVPGVGVIFTVLTGGGSVVGGNQLTNADGMARVGNWILGPSAGPNTLQAQVVGFLPVVFTATGTAGGGGGGGFNIEVRFVGGLSPSQQEVFTQAAQRWRSIVTGDLPDIPINTMGAPACGDSDLPAIDETVDDLVIFAQGEAIDGVGKILGQAGPCSIRSEGGLPIYGRMKFDAADLANLESSGRLLDVIIHEMGHVLGVGSLWDFSPFFSLLTGRGGPDPFFTGAGAIAAFDAAGGVSYPGNKVPVENSGGAGTRDSHWRESIFQNELMTGFLDSGSNPLSTVTIASLADMGYLVDESEADAYTVPPLVTAPGREDTVKLPLLELPMPPPEVVGPDGRGVGPPAGS